MAYPNIFEAETLQHMIQRLDTLKPDTQPQWGKMNAAQMLAHVNVGYGLTHGEIEVKYNPVMKLMFKLFLKKIVVGDKPYKKNSQTAPVFKIEDEKEFNAEKQKLIGYLNKTHQLGASHFEGKESPSFGKMTAAEWSNQFGKHLDHHFTQFGI